jgi:hypothetical protein
MLTSSLIVSRQPNRSAPCPSLPPSSQVTKSPVVHPLSIQQVTKCFSRNSFVLKTIHLLWGCVPWCVPPGGFAPRPSSPRLPIPYSPSLFFSHSSALFCTFLHACKTQLLYFQILPHSLPKKHGRLGVSRAFTWWQESSRGSAARIRLGKAA